MRPLDENLRQIETALDVSMHATRGTFRLDRQSRTDAHRYQSAAGVLRQGPGFAVARRRAAGADRGWPPRQAHAAIPTPALITRKQDLHGRTPRQDEYLQNIQNHDITFGVGPAGTGKTYLAVACAVDALEREQCSASS